MLLIIRFNRTVSKNATTWLQSRAIPCVSASLFVRFWWVHVCVCGGGMWIKVSIWTLCSHVRIVQCASNYKSAVYSYSAVLSLWCSWRYCSRFRFSASNNLIITRSGKYKTCQFTCALYRIVCLLTDFFHWFDSEHAPERSGRTVDANGWFKSSWRCHDEPKVIETALRCSVNS